MKKTIVFDNNSVKKYFWNLRFHFDWSEENFGKEDLLRNITNTVAFEGVIKELQIYGAETEFGTYNDSGYLRIGYAKINGFEVVKNGDMNSGKLIEALREIAQHPDEVETVR